MIQWISHPLFPQAKEIWEMIRKSAAPARHVIMAIDTVETFAINADNCRYPILGYQTELARCCLMTPAQGFLLTISTHSS